MIEPRILQRATIVGTVLQIGWVLIGHFFPAVRGMANLFLFGVMMISALAGYLYAVDYASGFGRGILGGAIAGGVCALIGVAGAVLIGDAPFATLALWTAISVVTGAAGGFWGQIAARMQGRTPRR
ncbi:MAG: hypothetical protein JOZ72_17015 [Alphaproteobacteria bacterium]|nr:hypothetical protein [Alphaproteobacteria bacterium]